MPSTNRCSEPPFAFELCPQVSLSFCPFVAVTELVRPLAMRRKIIIAVGVGLLLVIVFGVCLFLGVLSPHAPKAWSQVHAGMSRSQVLLGR